MPQIAKINNINLNRFIIPIKIQYYSFALKLITLYNIGASIFLFISPITANKIIGYFKAPVKVLKKPL